MVGVNCNRIKAELQFFSSYVKDYENLNKAKQFAKKGGTTELIRPLQ